MRAHCRRWRPWPESRARAQNCNPNRALSPRRPQGWRAPLEVVVVQASQIGFELGDRDSGRQDQHAQLFEIQARQTSGGAVTAAKLHSALMADMHQAPCAKPARQGESQAGVGAGVRDHPAHGQQSLGEMIDWLPRETGRRGLHVFDHQPSPRLQCPYHPVKREVRVWQMLEDSPRRTRGRTLRQEGGQSGCRAVGPRHRRVGPSREIGCRGLWSGRPCGPTRSEIQRVMVPPPTPISRQLQPFATPRARRWRIVPASCTSARAARRSRACGAELSNTYITVLPSGSLA